MECSLKCFVQMKTYFGPVVFLKYFSTAAVKAHVYQTTEQKQLGKLVSYSMTVDNIKIVVCTT